jgi:putative DNA primase/helicase
MTDPTNNVVARLQEAGYCPKAAGTNKWSSKCPGHDGDGFNLSVERADDGRTLLHCHAHGCLPEAILGPLGLKLRDLFPEDPSRANGKARRNGKPRAFPTPEAALATTIGKLGKPTASWVYHHADGTTALKVYRFDPPDARKEFRPVHPTPLGWALGDPPGALPLYHLPQLASAERIFIGEGEKVADLLFGLGLTASTSAHGSKSSGKTDWAPLAGKVLVVLPDNDRPGESYLKAVLGHLARLNSRPTVYVVRLTDLWRTDAPVPQGGDIAELLTDGVPEGWGPEDCRAHLERVAERTPLEDLDALPDPSHEQVEPNESDEDPHRLARIYLGRVQHPEGLTLRFWRQEWHRWDGTAYRVAPDAEVKAELTSTVKEEFDRLNRQAIGASSGSDSRPKVKPVTTKLISNVTQALTGMALLRVKDVPAAPAWISPYKDWDALDLLPARNALIHLPSLLAGLPCTIAPTPALFCSYALDFDFDRHAPKPTKWFEFLAQLWEDDHQSIELLQEWFGYLLTADTSQQKMLMLIGPKRSGKGTIARILRALISPDNVASPTLSKLAYPFGLAPLLGKRAAIISDARLSGRTDQAIVVERLLSITGEDSQSIDRKHREDWEGKLSVRFLLISNELPRLTDASAALPSRMLVLKLTKSFLGHEDRKLLTKLLPELPGILLWAIEGWRRLHERGHFLQPESARDLAEEMEDLASPIGAFLKDCCRVDRFSQTNTRDLFRCWKRWCDIKGIDRPGNEQNFGRNLRAAVPHLTTTPTRQSGKQVRFYVGVALVHPPDEDREERDDRDAF